MPYASVSELPEAVKKLPPKKRRQWMHVFNSVYAETGDDGRAARAAWSAVGGGKKYEEEHEMNTTDLVPSVIMTLPIVKVDKQKREIVGVATSEIVDTQGEILQYPGSKKAFGDWVGNIREMHQPKAVGRGVGVSFDDAKKRIIVRARVSKGAPDTWEKVLDGTLSHYSVGGMRVETEKVATSKLPPEALKGVTDPPEEVLVTKRWKMTELSLVDSGANPEARFELVKSIDGVPTETEIIEHEPESDPEGLLDEGITLPEIMDKLMTPGGEYPRSLVSASVKRARSEQLARHPGLFYMLYDSTLIKLEEGTRVEAAKDCTLTLQELTEISFLMVKFGYYAMEMTAKPVDFKTAYERYLEDEKRAEVYRVTDILHGVILAIAMDHEASRSMKKKMLAESLGQFVDIFMGVVGETEKSSGESQKESVMNKEEEKGKAEPKVETPPAPAAPAVQAPGVTDVGKALEDAIASFSKKLDETLASVTTSVQQTVDAVVKRVEKLEAQPADSPVLRRHSKDGSSSPLTKAGGPVAIVDDKGDELTLPEVLKKIEETEKQIKELPFGDPKRTELELEAFKLHRNKKVLQGQGVWGR